jgi:PHD/YefM family antitoxin component YafN of YafNO toxin-antitoxin module
MLTVSPDEVKEGLDGLIVMVQRDPISIRVDGEEVAVMLSAAAYRKLVSDRHEAFARLLNDLAERAIARGLTMKLLSGLKSKK